MITAYSMFQEIESRSHTQVSRFWIWFSTTVTTKTKTMKLLTMFWTMKATHHALQHEAFFFLAIVTIFVNLMQNLYICVW